MSFVEYYRQDHSAHQIKSQYDSRDSLPRSYSTLTRHDMSASSSSSNDSTYVPDSLVASAQAVDRSHGSTSRVPSLSPPPHTTPALTEAFTHTTFAGANGRTASPPPLSGSQGARSGRTSVEPIPFARQSPAQHWAPGDESNGVDSRGTSGGAIKVVRWAPERGEEGLPVTIVLDPVAVRHVFPNSSSSSSFGPGSPLLTPSASSSSTLSPQPKPNALPITRRFVVLFGGYPSPTKFSRAHKVDEVGLATTDDAEPFVVLTTYVPARQSMGSSKERVMMVVRIVDEASKVLEQCLVGEWDPLSQASSPRLASLKREGEDLASERKAPRRRSPYSRSPAPNSAEWASPPHLHRTISPVVPARTITPPDTDPSARGPPHSQSCQPADNHPQQPELVRTSQIPSGPTSDSSGASVATYSNKAVLKLQGDLDQMAMGWSNEEWTNRRRLVQFWRNQDGNNINMTFRPISPNEYVLNSIVISCIFRDEWNECFVTSVDAIYLLEALVGTRFSVEEKNRIRRNLEGFKPITVSKAKAESEPFFKLIMGFPNPKPRNIEKDVKVFPWKVLSSALKKVMSKYSATYSAPVDGPTLNVDSVIPQAGPSSPRPLDRFPSHAEQPHPQHSPCQTHHPPSPPATHPSIASAQFVSRPTSFDFTAILETTQFSSSGPSSGPPALANGVVYAPPEPHAYPLPFAPSEEYPSTDLNPHVRSYSDGPKRGYGYAGYQGEYYAQEWEGRREGWRFPQPPVRPASADGGGRSEMMYHPTEYPHER